MSAVLVQKAKTATIGVNALHHPNRQRFSVAHELGHYLMHADRPTVFVAEPRILRANCRFTTATRGELLSSCQERVLPDNKAVPAAWK